MTDTINLTKGSNVNLSKTAPGVSRFVVGLGWNPNPQNPPDLDASAFPCVKDANGDPKLLSPASQSFVFYGNLKSADGAIVHSGDNLTGDGAGDDERITIDTSLLNPAVDEIIVAVTIHEAAARNQNFGLVRNAYVRVYEEAALLAAEAANPGMTEADYKALAIANYDLEEDAGGATALQFGTFYKKDGEFRFKALGVPAAASLADFVKLLAPAGTTVS
ncbi:putative TerD-like bacterial stress protein [Caulobacter phage CcrColossus]|uniref:Putative TerD-like bacterial stress protein n=1 Tax=Caulobacter phage CcrColossus TaxID=1211640 RepID=K4JRX3_9CAUD|nr:putative TerD-like bacterial stress protein [Caulobacter phage CcrColossus]AFU88089.1 putative TerD-like bacterial stress protein [Caulobacter phage CcrColossus]